MDWADKISVGIDYGLLGPIIMIYAAFFASLWSIGYRAKKRRKEYIDAKAAIIRAPALTVKENENAETQHRDHDDD